MGQVFIVKMLLRRMEDNRRRISDKNILEKFCKEFVDILEKHSKYIIVSGFVAIASGRSRSTEDIDMIIEKLSFEKFNALHNDLTKGGFICINSSDVKDLFAILSESTGIRYVWKGRDFLPPEMEVKFAKDSIDNLQMETRQKLPLTGLDFWFSSINMNIAFKEELLKGEKDMEDAKHLRIVYADEVNEQDINKYKEMIRSLRMKEKKEYEG